MSILWRKAIKFRTIYRQIAAVALGLLLAAPAFAQANSPWENAVNVLQTAFTSTIARGLSLVAIVVAGLTFAFGEGGDTVLQSCRNRKRSFDRMIWEIVLRVALPWTVGHRVEPCVGQWDGRTGWDLVSRRAHP